MEYSLDLATVFGDLYKKHGNSLFEMIENAHEKMSFDDDERFFVDELSHRVDLEYEPTNESNTKLPHEVFDYFNRATEPSAGAFYRDERLTFDEECEPVGIEDRELFFSHDIAELLLVLTGQINL